MRRKRHGRVLRRFGRAALFAFGLLISLPVLGYFAVHTWIALIANPNYAREVFSDLLPYDAVLASKKWHAIGDEAWACTYAIVELGDNAVADPPLGAQSDWRLVFVGDWKPTPEQPPEPDMRDPVGFCSDEWTEDIETRLTRALAGPGSWYWTDGIRETMHIYSAPEHLAARIRWGD